MRRVIPDQGSVVELQTQAMPDCRAGDDGAVDELGRKRWKNAEGPAWADAQGVTEIEARPGRPGHGAPERCAARAGLRPGGWRAEHASRTNGCCHHRVWWQVSPARQGLRLSTIAGRRSGVFVRAPQSVGSW